MEFLKKDNIGDLLEYLEHELKRLQLWSLQVPDANAFSSNAPFFCDTLELEQWLQWVFIPRIREMLTTGLCLPNACNISDYADEYYRAKNCNPGVLIELLAHIDNVINHQNQPPAFH